ncbi:MAG TPA: hypothetical protein VG454_06230, partial [Gemmatimonadales bacterium]|nr:hypothetical protein [Gemmatimonadales bacterium]
MAAIRESLECMLYRARLSMCAAAALAFAMVLSSCGNGENPAVASAAGPTLQQRLATLFGDEDQLSCTDRCNQISDAGVQAACLQCCNAGANAFAGCDTTGALFDPLTCQCTTTC